MRAMEIANPIYDAAFKYLMGDRRVASLVIAKITGLAVESVEFRAQEVSAPREGQAVEEAPMPPLALFRMDFVARVQTAAGPRQVLVEIQKAKAPTVVERFRVYLGEQYASAENMTRDAQGREEAVPLVTVYLLGYDLGLSDEPVLDALPSLTERRTGRALDARHPFVAGITHRAHIVQIPRLASRRRDDLERFLSVFDQGQVASWRGDAHVLSVDESAYPEEGREVLRKLHEAVAEEEVRRYMRGEDLLLRDTIVLSHQLDDERQRAERADERAERADERAEQERQRAEQADERAEQERERAEQQLARSVRHLHALGQSAGEIAEALGIEVDRATAMLRK